MKKILAVGLSFFILFMSIVVIGGFFQKQQKENAKASTTSGSASTRAVISTATTDTFSIDEVSKHNTTKDCWLIINDKVYSVGTFLGEHPGGAFTIIPYCGKQATRAFDTQDRGRGGGHSNQASQMLADYLVGGIRTN